MGSRWRLGGQGVPCFCLLLAVPQGFGAQLAAVEDLALGDRVGHEVDEDGVCRAVVDVDVAQGQVVDLTDQRLAQVHVFDSAQ